ncbi:MAG: SDR family NAD(P)-dependent oxidoreductase [Alphaproteobacteria bacterium]|nr:SDR family NAD(P)-dependent oxidoreductase [Alphaproteobacteria bacterium]MCZ6765208.1 SDR family NAD(P)-dependent oxidoreductase [Alphaproteobacteria bacterium]
MPSSAVLQDRVALVTGASRGIGAAVAARLVAEGATVVLLARTVGALEEVDDAIHEVIEGAQTLLVPADLADGDRLDQLGPSLMERFGRLDILVANAAMLGGLMPLGHYQPKDWRQIFEVNLHANWHLIRVLDPLLRQSDAGRAIFVTADVSMAPKPFWGAYASAKAALEVMALTWAAEAKRSNLKVNLIDPGPVATRLRAEAYPGEDPNTLRRPDDVTDPFLALASPDCTKTGERLVL